MGLFDAFTEWKASRYENHIANMQAQDKCPDCNGKGFNLSLANEFVYYTNSFDCPGCNGSGLFSDWQGD